MLKKFKNLNLDLIKTLKKISKSNFFAISTIFALLGVLGFNLWYLVTKTQPPSPTLNQLIAENFIPAEKSFGDVLSESTKAATTQTQVSSIEGRLSIALLGDSMIDTMGDLKILGQTLNQFYPKVEFNLLNFGVGATRPSDGLRRLTESTAFETKNLPPLLSLKPDIVVLESFSYNHGKNAPDEIDNHYQTLKQIVNKLKNSNIEVVFLVTIAPSTNYAKGAPGILWDQNQRKLEAETVLAYLRAGVKFAQDQNLVLTNGFTPSLDQDGFGKQIYVNAADNIHPSENGIELVSDLIAQKIMKEKLVEKILKP